MGRHREMEELETALIEMLTGQRRLMMLAGEPGIGETRIAREVSSHAEMPGFIALWANCNEEESAAPYWPWVQIIRSYLRQCQPEQLWSEMGPGAADIAQIAPELLTQLPNLESAQQMEVEQARFRLLDSITTFAVWG